MFEDRPVLKDRLQATATFSGIAIAAVAGFEMVIAGGFDFLTPGSEIRPVAPSSYVAIERAPWSPEMRVIPLSSREPLFAGAVEPIEVERPSAPPLAGGPRRDAPAPVRSAPALIEQDIYRQIEQLYAGEAPAETAPYEDAPIIYEDAPAIDQAEQDAAPPRIAEEIEPDSAVPLGSGAEAS